MNEQNPTGINTALAVMQKYVPSKIEKDLRAIDQTAGDMALLLRESKTAGSMQFAVASAVAMDAMRSSLTPEVMKYVMKLQGKPHGFLTDRDKGKKLERGRYEEGEGYDIETVTECLIIACAKGAHVMGNEFNIIKAKVYLTREYYASRNDEILGAPNWSAKLVDIVRKGGAALGRGMVWWRDSAGEHKFSADFEVKTDPESTYDFIKGKWERRAYRMIFEKNTGVRVESDEEGANPGDSLIDTTAEAVKTEKAAEAGEERITAADQSTLATMGARRGLTKEEIGCIIWESGYQNDVEIKKCDFGAILEKVSRAEHGKVIKDTML